MIDSPQSSTAIFWFHRAWIKCAILKTGCFTRTDLSLALPSFCLYVKISWAYCPNLRLIVPSTQQSPPMICLMNNMRRETSDPVFIRRTHDLRWHVLLSIVVSRAHYDPLWLMMHQQRSSLSRTNKILISVKEQHSANSDFSDRKSLIHSNMAWRY